MNEDYNEWFERYKQLFILFSAIVLRYGNIYVSAKDVNRVLTEEIVLERSDDTDGSHYRAHRREMFGRN